jgi:hypothetical protein
VNNQYLSKTLAVAVAMACAGNASALNLSSFNEADTANQLTLRISGSSAHDKGLLQLLRLTAAGGAAICAPNTLDVYTSGSLDTTPGNDTIYFCTAGADAGFAAGAKRLAIIKRSGGGSGTGVGGLIKAGSVPLDDGTNINSNFLNPTNATVVAAAGVVQAVSGNFSAFTMHKSISSSLTVASATGADVGISDEEPTVFKKVFNPDLKNSELAALTVKGISSVIFGVPVTRGIYERLQAVEFPTTNVCNPNNAGYGNISNAASNANLDACMPSLSRAQLQGLYTGNIGDWAQLTSSHTAGLNVATATTPDYSAGMVDTQIYLERRVSSSGTQKGFEIYFTGEGCLDGAQSFLASGANVVLNSSGSTIPTNLKTHDNAGRGALGVLSSELVVDPTGVADAATGAGKWRFVKMNGAAPTVLNSVKGSYDMFFESTLQYRNATVNTLPALSTAKKAVADAIGAKLGLPNVVNDLNVAFTQTYGRGGLLGNAVDNAADAPVAPYVAVSAAGGANDVYAKPIALSTRGASGAINACLSPVTVLDSQASSQ